MTKDYETHCQNFHDNLGQAAKHREELNRFNRDFDRRHIVNCGTALLTKFIKSKTK